MKTYQLGDSDRVGIVKRNQAEYIITIKQKDDADKALEFTPSRRYNDITIFKMAAVRLFSFPN